MGEEKEGRGWGRRRGRGGGEGGEGFGWEKVETGLQKMEIHANTTLKSFSVHHHTDITMSVKSELLERGSACMSPNSLSHHTHSLVLVGMLAAMLMRTPLESTTHCWLHLQHRNSNQY